MEQVLCVPISTLRYSQKKRHGVSRRRVEELRREIESDRDVLPIRVHTLGDGTYVVRDGRHRLEAHIAAGFSMIAVYVENLAKRFKRFICRLFTSQPNGLAFLMVSNL